MSKKIVVSFGANWSRLRVAVSPKDLARMLEFVEGLEFVEAHYENNELSWYQLGSVKPEITLVDEILPPKADE